MLRVDIRNARKGMKLALPVLHPASPGHTLLRMHYELEEEAIARLIELRVRSIWVQYPSLDFIGKYVNREVMEKQGELVSRITDTFSELQQESTAKLPYDSYCKSIGNLIESLVGNPKSAIFLDDLGAGDNELNADLMRHSSTVTYLSLLMGLRLEAYIVRQRRHTDPMRAKDLSNLGIGAMLHDVGITRLDKAVAEEYFTTGKPSAAWREHTTIGYELVHGQIEPTAATCVLHHHQRFNGAGYCGKNKPVLQGERIHVFARIVGLADYFDRLRHPMKGKPRATVEALGTMLQPQVIDQFDPQVLHALFAVVPPYPPGSIVRLNNRQYAVVVDHNMQDPCQPTVQCIPNPEALDETDFTPGPEINLCGQNEYWIVECDGQDVSGKNFRAPVSMLEYPIMRHAV